MTPKDRGALTDIRIKEPQAGKVMVLKSVFLH